MQYTVPAQGTLYTVAETGVEPSMVEGHQEHNQR